MDSLNVNSIYVIEENVLGFGRRIGIWFQGCSLKCEYCIAPELQEFKPKNIYSPENLFNFIAKFSIKEITLTGGEPFEQNSKALKQFLRLLRKNDFGIWVYSGYKLNELLEKGFYNHIKLIDVLVDGRYIREKDDNCPFRGSNNQVIHIFSSRYKNLTFPEKRKIQINIKNNEIIIIGMPPKDFFVKYK